MKLKQHLTILFALAILVNLFVWLPFLLGSHGGMPTVFKNYDGPNYVIISKTWYRPEAIATTFSLPQPLEYYPAHLPAYPLSIAILNWLLPGPWAMLVATTVFTGFAVIAFYLLVFKFKLSTNPFWLSVIFLVFPARWVTVKAVGSPEPLFLFAIIASLYFFKSAFDKVENNLWSSRKIVWLDLLLAGIFGAMAQVTKSPGIILWVGYLLYLTIREISNIGVIRERISRIIANSLPLIVIPLSALIVFWFYKVQAGDFWAYFHSGDNFHLFFPPFQAFSSTRTWLGDFWREDLVWQYLIGALTVVLLIKQKHYDLVAFAGLFFATTLFVAHRDLARYSLPLLPVSLIAFDSFLQKKEFKIALLIILPAIYLFTINFIAGNTAPVADWTPYL